MIIAGQAADELMAELGAILVPAGAALGRMPEEGPCYSACPICLDLYTPVTAYRPHTLTEDCWCVLNGDGHRIRERCQFASQALQGR